MLAIIGTIPEENFPILFGKVEFSNDCLFIEGRKIPIQRGTSALIAATCKVLQFLKREAPYAYLAGDTGKGYGSKSLYEFFVNHIKQRTFDVLTFHYLLPDADWCNKILFAIDDLQKRPFLIADAGFMYAAKMSGNAKFFDLFTPDPGELAFLADEEAPHPFYTRGFILQDENRVEELINRAYKHENASKYMLVKGARDYIIKEGKIVDIVSEPCIEFLEPIGGTGDTLTGITSALIDSGFSVEKSMIQASKINRLAGMLSNPDPSTQIEDIIKFIPEAMKKESFDIF